MAQVPVCPGSPSTFSKDDVGRDFGAQRGTTTQMLPGRGNYATEKPVRVAHLPDINVNEVDSGLAGKCPSHLEGLIDMCCA